MRGGQLNSVPASAGGAKAVAVATAFTNFTYEGEVKVGPIGDVGLIFRVSKPDIGADAYCGYYAGISAEHGWLTLGCVSNSWRAITNVPMTFATNTTYRLKVEAKGPQLRVFVNGAKEPVVDVRDSTFRNGMVGVRLYCPDGDRSISSFSELSAVEVQKASNRVSIQQTR